MIKLLLFVLSISVVTAQDTPHNQDTSHNQDTPHNIAFGATVGTYDGGLMLGVQGYLESLAYSALGARIGFAVSFSSPFDEDDPFFGMSGAAPEPTLPTISDYRAVENINTSTLGRNTRLSFDATFDLSQALAEDTYPLALSLYAGGRYNRFYGDLEFTGDLVEGRNRATIRAHQFGVGFGALLSYYVREDVRNSVRLVSDVGLDIYGQPTFELMGDFGSGNVSPSDAAYSDYDGLVRQPSSALTVQVGVVYSF